MNGQPGRLEQAHWNDAWRSLGVAAPTALLAELLARHAEPHRAYHTIQHLRDCFAWLDALPLLADRLGEVQLAVWFHDAIYDTRAADNEERSARWAAEALGAAGVDPAAAARVHDLVLATKHDALPSGADARLLVDVDLSILGAEEGRFAEYERQIRHEYAWVPEAAFRQGRAQVLAGFLERPSVYHTGWFKTYLEDRARANLSRSLRALAV